MYLLSFTVSQVHLGRFHYILLPKLSQGQMQALSRRLEVMGFSVRLKGTLTAKSDVGTIHVDPGGLCWSNSDPADAILPVIPDLLSGRKERIPLEELKGLYFTSARIRRETVVKLRTRIESSSRWEALRAAGGCGLAPDERTVALFLIERLEECSMLTDFSTEGSTPRRYGRRVYFDSPLDAADAVATIRIAGESGTRNSYLPKDNVLRSSNRLSFSRRNLSELFEELGEWCYFLPR